MNTSSFLVQAAIYLSAAIILVPVFKRLGLGSVLGYLIAGILIGPYALKLIADPEHVLHFAEFGVVLMLFLIGLELESQKVWELRKLLFGLGGLQVTLTIGLVTVIAHSLHFSWPEALIIGMGVAMSSTAIGLTALIEKKTVTHGWRPGRVCHLAVSGFIGDPAVYAAGVYCAQPYRLQR